MTLAVMHKCSPHHSDRGALLVKNSPRIAGGKRAPRMESNYCERRQRGTHGFGDALATPIQGAAIERQCKTIQSALLKFILSRRMGLRRERDMPLNANVVQSSAGRLGQTSTADRETGTTTGFMCGIDMSEDGPQ